MTSDDDSAVRRALAKRLARLSSVVAGKRAATTLDRSGQKALRHFVAEAEFDALRRRCRLRELSALQIFPGIEQMPVPLSAIDDETGHANHAEMLYVNAAAALRRPARIFEFGTFLGRTTLHLARMNPEAQVWTLDLPRAKNPWRFADHVGSYFAGTPEASRIHFLREDARAFDPSPYRASMDFIWVDGDHSYKGVKNDTKKALDMLAPGGAIFWHDFGPDSLELVRYFSEFTRKRPLFRIRRTSVLVHLDGVDPLVFKGARVPFSKDSFRRKKS